MTSIALPPLPMPYPARVNPHHAHARAAAKRWAYDIGILGSDESVWDEAAYEANDFAKFAAYGFPNASADELELLTEWYVFGWFVDDHFERLATSSSDPADDPAARARRLRAFTPVEPDPDAAAREPDGAVERGMADLWPRTVPGTSSGWRRRFTAAFHGAIGTSIGLLKFPEDDVLDPMEYVDVRRDDGGLFWTAKLVEHSVRAEVPDRLAGTRPLRVIETSFADVVGLRNDLFSYARDIKAGSSFNVVPVLADGFGCSHQEAADLVGDLLTGRMNQLEDTVRDELPLLAARTGMTGAELASVDAYVQALRDHMAGDLRWHRETARYGTQEPPPSGTGAARTRRVRRPSTARAAHFAGRPLAMPYRMRRNPHHEVSGRKATDWARAMGLLRPNGVPGSGAWTEQQFTSENLGHISSSAYPDALPSRLELVSQWLVFVLYMDDLVVELFKRGRPLSPADLTAADTLFARLPAFMPADRDAPVPPPVNILESCLADLWPRSAELFPSRVDGLAEYCSGHLWEIFNLHQRRVPEPLDYFDWRRRSFADTLNITYIRNSADFRLHPALTASRQLRALDSAAMDTMLLFNDVFSARKEVELERCLSTATLPLERLLGQTRAESLRTLNDLADVRLRRFDHIATEQLPALTADLDLDADALTELDRYVDALRAWLAAVHHWHHAGDRFSTWTTPGPTLGTSATRPTATQAARTLRNTLTTNPPHLNTPQLTTTPSQPTAPDRPTIPSRPTAPGTVTTPSRPTAPDRPVVPGVIAIPGGAAAPSGGTRPGEASGPGGGAAPGIVAEPGGGAVPGIVAIPGGAAGPGGGAEPGRAAVPGRGTRPGGAAGPGGGAAPGIVAEPGGGAEPGIVGRPGGVAGRRVSVVGDVGEVGSEGGDGDGRSGGRARRWSSTGGHVSFGGRVVPGVGGVGSGVR